MKVVQLIKRPWFQAVVFVAVALALGTIAQTTSTTTTTSPPPVTYTFQPDGSGNVLTVSITPKAVTPTPAPTPTPTPTPTPAGATWAAPGLPQHYPHIRLALTDYGSQSLLSSAATLLQNSLDLTIGGPAAATQAVAGVNPKIGIAAYINITQLTADDQASWATYAANNNLNVENAYYHSATPASASNRIVSNYAGRYCTNPKNGDFQTYCVYWAKQLLASRPGSNGIFVDNSGSELPNGATAIEDATTFQADYAALLSKLAAGIAPVFVMQNTDYSGNDPIVKAAPFIYLEDALRPLAHPIQTVNSLIGQVQHMGTLGMPTPWVVLDSNPQTRNADGTTGTGNQSDPRTQMAALAEYYLMADPTATFLAPWSGNDTMGDWGAGHFWAALTYNVGTPAGGVTTFATGADPTATSMSPLTYTVLARQYSGALILFKPVSFSNWSSPVIFGPLDATGATTHALGGNYQPLNVDGTLGAAVSSISLQNGAGVILIKSQ